MYNPLPQIGADPELMLGVIEIYYYSFFSFPKKVLLVNYIILHRINIKTH